MLPIDELVEALDVAALGEPALLHLDGLGSLEHAHLVGDLVARVQHLLPVCLQFREPAGHAAVAKRLVVVLGPALRRHHAMAARLRR